MAKKALGKGLDALIVENTSDNEKPISQTSYENVVNDLLIPVSALKPNPFQPRTEFNMEALQELSLSIKEHGVIQPVLVEKIDEDTYYIIAGERRTRAAQLAGLTHIPARIQKLNDVKKLEYALIENIQRENLNPLEEARAYHELMSLANLNQEEVAKRLGKKRSTLANALRLLKLPENMQTAIIQGQLSSGHARAILSVLNTADQQILFARIIGSGLSVREAEVMAQEMNEGKKAKAKKTIRPPKGDPNFLELEQKLINTLGTKVQLKGNFSKGSIVIDYFSKDDLDKIYTLLLNE